MTDDLFYAAQKVSEAASDYLLGLRDPEFAELNGGVEALLESLRDNEARWQMAHPEADCRDIT